MVNVTALLGTPDLDGIALEEVAVSSQIVVHEAIFKHSESNLEVKFFKLVTHVAGVDLEFYERWSENLAKLYKRKNGLRVCKGETRVPAEEEGGAEQLLPIYVRIKNRHADGSQYLWSAEDLLRDGLKRA